MRQFRTIEDLWQDDTIKLKVVNAPTIRIPAIRQTCQGWQLNQPCEYTAVIAGLCRLCYYQAKCREWWDQWRQEGTA
jgi:hypothetical protein